jgi:glutamine synthetase
MKTRVEYVWIGGNNNLRGKTKVMDREVNSVSDLSEWNYDGSSTNQAAGEDSEVIIKPCALFNDPFRRGNHKIVLCDTYRPDGTPLENNHRQWAKAIFDQALDEEPWYGLEQEYFLIDPNTNKPLGFPQNGFPNPQGQYYCSVGATNAYGRKYFEEALDNCLKANLPVTGTNFEVCAGQLEIQVCSTGLSQGDNLLITRYILQRTGEKYGLDVNFSAKPIKGDWNGSGCHTNFSTKEMRENDNGYELILEAIEKLREKHEEHIKYYGNDNSERLTGLHETAHISDFSSGVANRGASIRIPRMTEKDGKGYFEDRRPSSSCDPYIVTSMLFKTCCL